MNYHKIEKTSVANGTGIRVVLWCSGCGLHCRGCQNPDTWSFNSGKSFDEAAKQELFDALDKPYIQGITFSGGHPFEDENMDKVFLLMREIKERFPDKDIWAYSGYTFEYLSSRLAERGLQNMLDYIDVIVDGAYIEKQKDITLKWRGSKNQRVIDVQKTLEQYDSGLYEVVLYCE